MRLGKNKEISKEINKEVINETSGEEITSYREYLIKDREIEKASIRGNIIKLQRIYDEAKEEYYNREDVKAARKLHEEKCKNTGFWGGFNINDPKLIKMNNALESLSEKLRSVDSKYKIDDQLALLAHKIDTADYQNKAIKISESIIKRLEELIPDINEATNLFKMCNISLPVPFEGLKDNVIRGVNYYYSNAHLDIGGSMKILDKNELKNTFNNRKIILDKEQRKKEDDDNLNKILSDFIK